jgi:hypothetical protein
MVADESRYELIPCRNLTGKYEAPGETERNHDFLIRPICLDFLA